MTKRDHIEHLEHYISGLEEDARSGQLNKEDETGARKAIAEAKRELSEADKS